MGEAAAMADFGLGQLLQCDRSKIFHIRIYRLPIKMHWQIIFISLPESLHNLDLPRFSLFLLVFKEF